MKESKKGTIFVLIAGIMWGSISLVINLYSPFGVSSADISFYRFLNASVIMFFVLLFYKKDLLKIKLRDVWMFVGTGMISLAFFNWCYITVMMEGEVSIASVLLYTSPIWVMIFSAIIFKEKITIKKIVALLLTFMGSIFVAGIFGSGTKLSPKLFLIGIGSGVGYALYSIFGRFALKKYNILTITFYTFLFALLGTVFISHPINDIKLAVAEPKIILFSLLNGVFCSVLPYFFYTSGLSKLETSKAAIIATVEPMVGCLLGIFVFKEGAGVLKILGILLILSAVIILNINTKKEPSGKQE